MWFIVLLLYSIVRVSDTCSFKISLRYETILFLDCKIFSIVKIRCAENALFIRCYVHNTRRLDVGDCEK